jgi:hypothetical protein
MTTARKTKLSVSLDADLVALIDRQAADESGTRSGVMARWLRQASRQTTLARLQEETASYYESLTAAERADDDQWARASSRAARRLKIDEPVRRAPRRK